MMKNLPVCSLILVVLASGIYGHPVDEVEEQICIPGEQTQEDCNTCTCSVDGTRMVCTRMGCRRMSDEHLNAGGPLLPHQNNLMHRTKRDQVCKTNRCRKVNDNVRCRCRIDGTGENCVEMMHRDDEIV